jgi:hypothetical protein
VLKPEEDVVQKVVYCSKLNINIYHFRDENMTFFRFMIIKDTISVPAMLLEEYLYKNLLKNFHLIEF